MKTFRTKSGPFSERPHFEPHEIDQICGSELRKVGLYPKAPEPIRVDRFVEKRFKVTPEYEQLPEGVLGYTKFGKSGVEAIVISAELDSDTGSVAQRRLRATLAHEAGHGLLHAHLFVMGGGALTLFDADSRGDHQILCRDVHDASRPSSYDGRWWEYQANKAIGALLLPRALLSTALKPYVAPSGLLGMETLDESRREDAARALADIFDVNPAVARIRINDVYPLAAAGSQLNL